MTTGGHHHRSGFGKQKPYKQKSKGKQKRLQKGRVDEQHERLKGGDSTGRISRANFSKQTRVNKCLEAARRKHLGHASVQQPPKIIALLPLHERANTRLIRDRIAIAAGADAKSLPATSEPLTIECSDGNRKFRLTLVEAHPTMLSMLDAAKVADIIVPIVCPFSSDDARDAYGIDERSDSFIAAIKAQALPAVVAISQGLSGVPAKRRHVVRKTCLRYVHTMFDEKVKMLDGDAGDDFGAVLRQLNNVRLQEIQWRSVRPYLCADSMRFDPGSGTVVVTGFVRGGSELSPNQLVHVTGFGDFQLNRIDFQRGQGQDTFEFVDSNPAERATLEGLRILDPLANEQSIITEEELREADEAAAKRRLQDRKQELIKAGVPEYKAAWEAVLPSDDEDEEAEEDEKMNLADDDQEAADDDHAKLALKFRMERDEMEFPDEVDTPTDQLAKVRFARYRGLKSFASSPWDANENLPLEYGQICKFQHFDSTRRRVLSSSSSSSAGIVAGVRVALYIANVSSEQASAMALCAQTSPLVVSGVLEHERSVSVCHYKVRRASSHDTPVRNKEALLWCVGFRRSSARPLFSVDSKHSDKHKVERFLPAGTCFSIASVYGRVTFGPSTVLALHPERHSLVASGSLLNCDPDRICVKRIVLTGYPIRVHKRKAVVRYMFFTPDDVRWFSPVQLSTKYGLVGQIDEPVGTHGYFKCSFNGFVKPHDTICLVLYKRQFPPWNEADFAGSQ